MAKKTALTKALDKRKKKAAKKSVLQVAPQSKTYSKKRDKKEKAKPAGYRFKGLDNFKTPTKKDIAADTGKPKSKRKTYFENRKDKSDTSPKKKLELGGDVNAHSSDTALTIQDQMKKGGRVKYQPKWIQKAIHEDKKGSLKKKAMQMGLIKSMDEKLSQDDLKKLIEVGGVTARRARLAQRLRKFEEGGTVNDFPYPFGFLDKEQRLKRLHEVFDDNVVETLPNGKSFFVRISETPISPEEARGNRMVSIVSTDEHKNPVLGREMGDTIVDEYYFDDSYGNDAVEQAMSIIKEVFENEISDDYDDIIVEPFAFGGPILPEDVTQSDVMAEGGETKSNEKPTASEQPKAEIEPEIELKLETTQKATIPNVESAAYSENMIDFIGSNLEGKQLPNGDYVVLSFLFYPIWFYCAKDQKWYGNTDKYNSVTAMHISQSRPTPNAELLPIMQLLDKMNQAIQTYDMGGMLVRQLYPMTFDNTTIAHQ